MKTMDTVPFCSTYGKDKSQTPKEEYLESLIRLREDLVRIEHEDEAVPFMRYINRAVGSDELGKVPYDSC